MSCSPRPGELYLFRTVLLSGRDKKPYRPGVVLAPPPAGLSDVPLLMRTTVLCEKGVGHQANPALGLSKEGVFGFRHQRYLDVRFFGVAGAVKYLGMLEASCFAEIRRWWETL